MLDVSPQVEDTSGAPPPVWVHVDVLRHVLYALPLRDDVGRALTLRVRVIDRVSDDVLKEHVLQVGTRCVCGARPTGTRHVLGQHVLQV